MNQYVSEEVANSEFRLPLYYVVGMVFLGIAATALAYMPVRWLLPEDLVQQQPSLVLGLAVQLGFLAVIVGSYKKYFSGNLLTAMAFTKPHAPLLLLALALAFFGVEELAFQFIETPQQDLLWMIETTVGLPLWFTLLTGVILAPLVEELFFRQMLWVALRDKFDSPLLATIISGSLWAAIHTQYHVSTIGLLFLNSLLLGYLRHKSGSVIPCILLHVTTNALATASVLLEWGPYANIAP